MILVGCFLLYIVAGFWIIPPLLKPFVEKQLSRHLDRMVSIQAIRLNPLVLSATIVNLTVFEPNNIPLAGFKELFIDAQLSSLFRWSAIAKEVRLAAPFGCWRRCPMGI